MATKPRRFTVEAGRQILRNGQPFVYIGKKEWQGASAAEVDEVTHVIAALLSRAKTYTYCGETFLVSTFLKGV